MQRILRWLKGLEDGILVAVLAAMIILAMSQVVLRNVWNSGLSWGDPLLRAMLLWLALLGAMAATRDRNHISIDALSGFFPAKLQRFRHVLIDTFSAFICGMLAWQGGRLVAMDRDAGTIAFEPVPAWVCELIIPIGFGIISLRFLLYVLLALRNQGTA